MELDPCEVPRQTLHCVRKCVYKYMCLRHKVTEQQQMKHFKWFTDIVCGKVIKKVRFFSLALWRWNFNQFHANCMQNTHLVNAGPVSGIKRMPATDMKIMLIVFVVLFFSLSLSLCARCLLRWLPSFFLVFLCWLRNPSHNHDDNHLIVTIIEFVGSFWKMFVCFFSRRLSASCSCLSDGEAFTVLYCHTVNCISNDFSYWLLFSFTIMCEAMAKREMAKVLP